MEQNAYAPGDLSEIRDAGFVVNGRSIPYIEIGEGDPVLYLTLGGGPRLTPMMQRLAMHCRILSLDVELLAKSEGSDDCSAGDLIDIARNAPVFLGDVPLNIICYGEAVQFAIGTEFTGGHNVNALVLISPPALRHDTTDEPLIDRGKIDVPTLALFGTRHVCSPCVESHNYAKHFEKYFPTFVYDANADPETDRPEATAGIVRNFFEHREGFLVSRESSVIYP